MFPDDLNYSCVAASRRSLKPVKKLRIRIISGHHLPKTADRKFKGDVIEPYIKIRIRGHPVDESEIKTEVVPKVLARILIRKLCGGYFDGGIVPPFQNGFNPIWETCTEFKLVYPELTFIEFQVKTKTKNDDSSVIGTSILPYILLRQGYRHVYLEDLAGHRLTPACLFLHIAVIDCCSNKLTKVV
jgi:hypothetical protein